MNPGEYKFLYTVDADADEPIMLIDRHIGYDETDGFGIMGDLFQKELLVLDSMDKSRIQVWINSPGGLVSDGYNIYNALLKTKTKVDTYCIGMAASIAGVIFQAGRKRIMNDYGILMYHNPFGTSNEKGLDAIKDSLVTMISSRSGMDPAACEKMMARTTFIDAAEAKDMGLCDEIEQSVDFNKKRALSTADEVKAFYDEVKNSLNFLTNKPLEMKKVANKLNLNEAAAEESIVAEIEKIQNKVSDQENVIAAKNADIKKIEQQLTAKQSELDAEKESLVKVKNELEALKADIKKEREAAQAAAEQKLEAEVDETINAYVAQGKIKNDATVIAQWKKTAKADLAGAKALIENLPINKVANKINIAPAPADAKRLTSVVANKMATLQAGIK